MRNVIGSMSSKSYLAIKDAIGSEIGVEISSIELVEIITTNSLRGLRLLQSSTYQFTVYIKTDNTDLISSLLSDTTIQQNIQTNLRNSGYTDSFANVSILIEDISLLEKKSDSSGLSAGGVVGIVFAVLIVVVLVIIGVFVYGRNHENVRHITKSVKSKMGIRIGKSTEITSLNTEDKEMKVVEKEKNNKKNKK